MKKYLILGFLVVYSKACYAGDWFIVGDGKSESDVNIQTLEGNLWAYLNSKSKIALLPREEYRYQYKFIGKNKIHINALCVMRGSSNETSEPPLTKNLKSSSSSSKNSTDSLVDNLKAEDIGAFPDTSPENLTKEFISVMDGGECFFQINYNSKTLKFENFYVNGHG
jgi:hypothetical protein